MVQKRFYRLNPPAEGDNQADLDRLLAAMAPEFGRVRVDYPVMREYLPILRASDYCVTATLIFEIDVWRLYCLQPGDTAMRRYGLACDLGSTTIAVTLTDLNDPARQDTRTDINPQVHIGTDILSRIFYAHEPGQEGVRRAELQRLAVGAIDGMIHALLSDHHLAPEDCPLLTVAGNTTMIHFLLSQDAFCVFSSPFAPMFNRAPILNAGDLGFAYPGRVCCFPSAANYLGGDILSGLWATDLTARDELSLFIDIGTNGEMAIGCRDFLIAGAGAAGPALEGGISAHGMRASAGAIDTVRIQDGRMHVTTIENAPIRGICGSGIVDLLAQMRAAGWMNSLGRLEKSASERIRSQTLPSGGGEELAVVYADEHESAAGEALSFTQSDILHFTDTKAAAGTMVACLLEAAGVAPEALDRVYLAGAFGEHLNLESAISIGLYPDLPRDRFVAAGNTSLRGAIRLLTDRTGLDRTEQMLSDIYYLEFAMQPNFLDLMASARYY